MALTPRTQKQIEHTFTYHPPKGDQAERYGQIREQGKAFALFLCSVTPESREQSLALTYLQQVVMMANCSIAIHESEEEVDTHV